MTLYERIGGAPAVTAAVERFYVRVLADPMLEPFFENVDLARLKRHQLAFLSQALGGPQEYSGATMSRAHARLRIEQRHFDAVAGHLVETLRELGVGEEIIGEVVDAVAPLASQIVNTGAASA
jgi:hemoglobin